ncbi:hypothetical protein EX30DRAFT_382852 [Ascodesmis nigricans]|uniref:Lysine-specific metallo-endopeptidase domain-containing protein n=1 Tax=Ascodesmis nigricans TaxID=341454 RepID=A0A4S2MPB6_9PEZI|nr:hypothetical protein EX30DRAFT_382852 [Ascodesmis nigricans]
MRITGFIVLIVVAALATSAHALFTHSSLPRLAGRYNDGLSLVKRDGTTTQTGDLTAADVTQLVTLLSRYLTKLIGSDSGSGKRPTTDEDDDDDDDDDGNNDKNPPTTTPTPAPILSDSIKPQPDPTLPGPTNGNLYTNAAIDALMIPHLSSQPSASISSKKTWTDSIPSHCYTQAQQRGVLSKLTVTEVLYSDCPESWIFCYTTGTPFSLEDLIKEFGRLPVGIRQRVRHVMAFPGGGASYAYSQNDVALQFLNPSVMMHEAGHCMDDFEQSSAFSASAAWKSARDADGCVSNPYASKNGVEGWAETWVVWRFLKIGGKLGRNWECMRRQLETVGRQTDKLVQEGYVKGRKVPRGSVVSRATGKEVGAGKRRRLGRREESGGRMCMGYTVFDDEEE